MLNQYSKLDKKIKQSDLDSRIKKHSEEIELQNQTLELHVIDQEIFTGDAKSNKLDELLTSLRQSWDSGWNAEIAESAEKAEANFAEYRKLAEKTLHIITLKQEGDSLFNKAVEQEEEAGNLKTYRLALETYEQAIQKYQDGEEFDGRFSECVEFCNNNIKIIKARISSIDISPNNSTEEIRDMYEDYVYIPSNSEEDNTPDLIGQVDYVMS